MGCCIIEFDVAEMDPAILDIGEDSVEWGANEYVEIHTSDYPEYSGSYEADALFSEQVFPAVGCHFEEDFLAVHLGHLCHGGDDIANPGRAKV